MRKETLILISVGVVVIALALTIPAIALGMMGWYSDNRERYYPAAGNAEPTTIYKARDGGMMGMGGMMRGMMGSMMGEHGEEDGREAGDGMGGMMGSDVYPTEGGPREDYEVEKAIIVGAVEDAFHMMLEVETENGEEVEVMVPHWWKVKLPNGDVVEVSGWELVEEYVKEGSTIVVSGYLFEMPMYCMVEEEDEAHMIAYSIELPELGITAELTG